jgi:membrane protease YdiL (CAAX protease family)
MKIKRLILLLLTIVSLIPVFLSLLASINEPQVQANLQLYLTNLTLQASEFQLDSNRQNQNDSNSDLTKSLKYLMGGDPYLTAKNQYQEAKKLIQNNINNLQKQRLKSLEQSSLQQLDRAIQQEKQVIQDLDLKLGIIEAQRGEIATAITILDNLIASSQDLETPTNTRKTAKVLKGLWSTPIQISPETEIQIEANLKGWFRYCSLKHLYKAENREEDLLLLQQKEQQIATQVLGKLVLINAIPLLTGLIGLGILIFLVVQFFNKEKQSLLASIKTLAWQIPWDGETIWQVFIVGFFFISQIILPVAFSILGFDPTSFSLRLKAIYVLSSYVLLAAAGLLVLYFSLKSFFPLPKELFRFKLFEKWIFWSLGGYLVALPLVFLVSLINQLVWQGQGGSNPLLFLALEAQDRVVLAIFFFTASVAAPFFEEIMFRGFLLPSLTRYLPVWGAIMVSSLVFAIAHLNLSEVLPLTILGIVLGVVYTRSRNLLASMFLHSLWNSGTLLSLFILGSGGS